MNTLSVPTTTTRQYTLQDFNNIINSGFSYNLNNSNVNVIDLISSLAEKVGAPTYIKTPIFPKREEKPLPPPDAGFQFQSDRRMKNKQTTSSSSSSSQITNDDWNCIRTFQKTEIIKSEGVNKRIDAIRALLNKLTDVTFSDILTEILTEVSEIIDCDGDGEKIIYENIKKIASSIFNTASSNVFYSSVYSRLFKELMTKHTIFSDIFEKSFSEFMKLFEKIEYIDPKVDYDKFCDIIKINDKRRAMSTFIVNLMKQRVLDSVKIIQIILQLQEMIFSLIKIPNMTNELEELNENIFIIVTNGKEILSTHHSEWEDIVSKIKFLSILKTKMKEYPSVNNKLIFKNMDILEELELESC